MQTRRDKKLLRRASKQARREQRLADRTLQPTKKDTDVFMSTRKTYHDHWCSAMNGVWLSGSNKIAVTNQRAAFQGGAEPCLLCLQITADALKTARLDSLDTRYV